MSYRRTTPATISAPVEWKMIEIQAGASRRIQVVRPGAASNSLSPNCLRRSENGEGGLAARAVDTARLCGGIRCERFAGSLVQAQFAAGSKPSLKGLVAKCSFGCR